METAIEKKSSLNPALIEKANEAEALLASKIEACKGLKINGLDDKVGYAAVSSARKELKTIRVNIEKVFKADRDNLNVFVKANSAKEKELLAKISPIEDGLYAQEKAIDDEKERIRLDAEQKEKQRIQSRIDAFSKYNYAIDFVIVMGMTDEQYESELSRVKNLYEAEQKAEQEKAAEVERLKKEEEERLVRVRKEQDAEAARLLAEAKKLNAEKERVAAEQKQREDVIKAEQAKIEAEKKALEDAKRKVIEDEERKIREEKIRKEAELKAIADAEAKAKKDQEEKEKAERLAKLEAERKAALLPDKEKAIEFLKLFELKGLNELGIKDENIFQIIAEYASEMESLIKKYRIKINAIK